MSASWDAASAGEHTPVLYQTVLAALQPRSAGRYIDGTLGAGGHARGILEASSPAGLLLGLDRDPAALAIASRNLDRFQERAILRRSPYGEMQKPACELGWTTVDGILLDLGLSSMQLADPARGFSFKHDGPLDMRFDQASPTTAADLVNLLEEEELAQLLGRYGEEPRSRRVARAIIAARPLHTTNELAEVVAKVAGKTRPGLHPATRTFQALRIAVNEELEQLEQGLNAALSLLAPGGRLAVIAFHSLEDRIVKQFMRRESQDCICPPEQPVCTCDHVASLRLLNRRPLSASQEEIERNPRSRSARLRVAERVPVA
jgi:16S rRNA (cytosine1402-N4)-methyltransferase